MGFFGDSFRCSWGRERGKVGRKWGSGMRMGKWIFDRISEPEKDFSNQGFFSGDLSVICDWDLHANAIVYQIQKEETGEGGREGGREGGGKKMIHKR